VPESSFTQETIADCFTKAGVRKNAIAHRQDGGGGSGGGGCGCVEEEVICDSGENFR
jgi:hypothetical protein